MVERTLDKAMYPRDVSLSLLDKTPELMGLNKRLAECELDYEAPEKKEEHAEPVSYPQISP